MSGRGALIVPKDLYFFQCGKTYCFKIGVSDDPAARLKTVQTSYPYPLSTILKEPGLEAAERPLHGLLKRFHLNGEWFESTALLFLLDEGIIQEFSSQGRIYYEFRKPVDRANPVSTLPAAFNLQRSREANSPRSLSQQ